jgi:hypothetical protein
MGCYVWSARRGNFLGGHTAQMPIKKVQRSGPGSLVVIRFVTFPATVVKAMGRVGVKEKFMFLF